MGWREYEKTPVLITRGGLRTSLKTTVSPDRAKNPEIPKDTAAEINRMYSGEWSAKNVENRQKKESSIQIVRNMMRAII